MIQFQKTQRREAAQTSSATAYRSAWTHYVCLRKDCVVSATRCAKRSEQRAGSTAFDSGSTAFDSGGIAHSVGVSFNVPPCLQSESSPHWHGFASRDKVRVGGDESLPTPPFHGQTLLCCAVSFLGCHPGNPALAHLLTDCNLCSTHAHTPFSLRKRPLANDDLKRKPRSRGHFYSGIEPSQPVAHKAGRCCAYSSNSKRKLFEVFPIFL